MGYLHAKGIIHKDLKSKNVFYDTNKVVITDFGLFGMSGVVQKGRWEWSQWHTEPQEVMVVLCINVLWFVHVFRRKNVLRIPQGWVSYLAPEIIRKMRPDIGEDQLPFSKAADVYAFGYLLTQITLKHSEPSTNNLKAISPRD